MAKRWRKQPNETGLASIGQRTRGYDLREGGEVLAQVRPLEKDWTVSGWYWYGYGVNTCGTPVETAELAKAQVIIYIKTKGL